MIEIDGMMVALKFCKKKNTTSIEDDGHDERLLHIGDGGHEEVVGALQRGELEAVGEVLRELVQLVKDEVVGLLGVGAGNLEGNEQSGSWVFRWFDWIADQELIAQTLQMAETILKDKDSFSEEAREKLQLWYSEKKSANEDGVH